MRLHNIFLYNFFICLFFSARPVSSYPSPIPPITLPPSLALLDLDRCARSRLDLFRCQRYLGEAGRLTRRLRPSIFLYLDKINFGRVTTLSTFPFLKFLDSQWRSPTPMSFCDFPRRAEPPLYGTAAIAPASTARETATLRFMASV